MRRALYLLITLVMLATMAVPAMADEIRQEEPLYLGELVLVVADGFAAGERVDAWLYAPSTLAGWPFTWDPPVGPNGTSWFLPIGASEQRRWSFSETEGTIFETADVFGIWGAIMMLPRDEVWFPCSFPLKWNCNYQTAPGVWELHSPQLVNYVGFPVGWDYWPWIDVFGAAADPADTVAPLEIYVLNYDPFNTHGWIFETSVVGYDWKWSDIP